MVAILGIGLTAASEVWVTTAHRQKMTELKWIGAQFTQAMESYYQSTPGALKVYPTKVEELLHDQRYVTVRRHLRAVYRNPFTGETDWEWIVGIDGRLQGVRVRVVAGARNELHEFFPHSSTPPKQLSVPPN